MRDFLRDMSKNEFMQFWRYVKDGRGKEDNMYTEVVKGIHRDYMWETKDMVSFEEFTSMLSYEVMRRYFEG